MNNWQKVSLKNVCNIFTGDTPSTSNPNYWNGGINWMSSGEVNKRRVFSTEKTISKEGLNNSNARMLPKGTVMIALAGQGKTRGKAAILEIETTCNQSLAGLVTKNINILNPEYLFQYLEKDYEDLRNLSGGEGRSGLNLKLIGDYLIGLPLIKQQKKISKILFSLDEAIEKTDQIIEKTELLKKGLMQELLTKGIGHKKFKKTKYGNIPEKWELLELKNVIYESKERNRKLELQTDSIMGVNKSSGLIPMKDRIKGKAIERYKIIKKGYFAYNPMRLNIGSIAYSEYNNDLLVSPDYVVFECQSDKLLSQYLNYYRQSEYWTEFTKRAGDGGVRVRIYYDHLGKMLLPVPPLEEQQKIVNVLHAIDNKLQLENNEKEKLLLLKKGLMKDIFSQKVQIN